jgi:hypothetical protein
VSGRYSVVGWWGVVLSNQSEDCSDLGTGRAATICNIGPDRWLFVTTIIVPGRTSVLQQECDCGMLAEPHIWAICLQHSCSWAVIALPGIMHANSGAAVQQIIRKARAVAARRRMM